MSEMSIREMCVAGAVIMENEVVALQSQLGQAREALLLAQADLEAVLTELRTYFTARTYGERGDARVQLKVLAREAHPGAALADEVAAARAALQAALDERDQWHDGFMALEISVKIARTQIKSAIARGAADHAVAEAARILVTRPDQMAWEQMYAALAVADKEEKNE